MQSWSALALVPIHAAGHYILLSSVFICRYNIICVTTCRQCSARASYSTRSLYQSNFLFVLQSYLIRSFVETFYLVEEPNLPPRAFISKSYLRSKYSLSCEIRIPFLFQLCTVVLAQVKPSIHVIVLPVSLLPLIEMFQQWDSNSSHGNIGQLVRRPNACTRTIFYCRLTKPFDRNFSRRVEVTKS